MASQAIGPTVTSRGGRPDRPHRRRLGDLLRKSVSERTEGEEWSPKATPMSRLARFGTLWSRTLEPVRPLDAPRASATAWDASWPLRRDPASVPRARRLVTAQLVHWNLAEPADIAELLVSEAVTNALRHTRGSLRLNLQVRGSRLRCEVEDTEQAGPVRRFVDVDSEGGRGIELLDQLSEAWGSTSTATGKTMWFELPAHAEAATKTPSPEEPTASA
ncbi:ATP-binding protein [Streptomyces sp. JH14]|uniref:ATP-binding protein n=1 Tax=Streptomyces sp. JH14 TaxID=2793630 RepID=UPI0023F704E7|nr:ATP-binding protein [Streptomyces sp. JH14]MDF6042263.1 ATP-binding protein [Streptomyces sp. JH14]